MLNSQKLNLERIQFLIVDSNPFALRITSSVISGFGGRNILKGGSAKEARNVVNANVIDFLLVAGAMPDEDGYAFVRWLRREGPEASRYVPVMILNGHTRRSQVLEARDSGAHAVIAKPVIPRVLLERTFWMARDERQFLECEGYVGPDRRFHDLGPAIPGKGRRKEDQPPPEQA